MRVYALLVRRSFGGLQAANRLGFVEKLVGHVLDVEAINVVDEADVLAFAGCELGNNVAAGVLGMNDRLKAALAEVEHHNEVAVAGTGWLGAVCGHVLAPVSIGTSYSKITIASIVKTLPQQKSCRG
jgi:hypothetical protein